MQQLGATSDLFDPDETGSEGVDAANPHDDPHDDSHAAPADATGGFRTVIDLFWVLLTALCLDLRQRMLLFAPLCLAVGIGTYFATPMEPSRPFLMALAGLGALGGGLARKIRHEIRPIMWLILLILLGFLTAGLRANLVAAPVLEYRFYGTIEGRVTKIDRSASRALRLTLDHVVLEDKTLAQTPDKIRISLHGPTEEFAIEPGQHLRLIGHLSPPSGPTEPGGFDFQRKAWFDGLGAVGYTRKPVTRLAVKSGAFSLLLHRTRHAMSQRIQAVLPDQRGAFAAALLTGDRSAVSQETTEALRGTNLSHLLAISGLHMGLLTSIVFAAVRVAYLLLPRRFAPFDAKKLAAAAALLAGGGYLALSGWNVATERAYIMVAMMFTAVFIGRRAISLRSVAAAAILILLLRPEVLPEPGFQMSFAATTALVAVFATLSRYRVLAHWPKYLRVPIFVVLSSAVAGLATAPVAAAHFNRIADYGLLANIVSVPLMGAVIMPLGVLALALMPLGLHALPLTLMSPAIGWILGVATHVSQWEGAVSYVKSPANGVLPLLAVGALALILIGSRLRVIGLVLLICGFWAWAVSERPDILVSDDGGLMGQLTANGRVLSKPKGAGFSARTWLENDGDGASQAQAAARVQLQDGDSGFTVYTRSSASGGTGSVGRLGGLDIVHITGRDWKARAFAACETADVVIVNKSMGPPPHGSCTMFDLYNLKRSGALAIFLEDDHIRIETAREVAGMRLWNTHNLRGAHAVSPRIAAQRLPKVRFGTTIARPIALQPHQLAVPAQTKRNEPPHMEAALR